MSAESTDIREIDFRELKPRNAVGALYMALAVSMTAGGVWLATASQLWAWGLGQLLLALAFLQWFSILHEAGHKTLFRTPFCNRWSGHVAGCLAGIPFESWRLVHGWHHKWTGWQDLDVTTSALVPRRLACWERTILNVCWRLWIPLFSILYRTGTYWNFRRCWQLFPAARGRLVANWVLLLLAYGSAITYAGMWHTLQLVGLGVLAGLIVQDIIILSQHTHIPMQLSEGRDVAPFAPGQQEVFTRSLAFPRWFSQFILLNLDAHELHHMHSNIPGYYLDRLNISTQNRVQWWQWVRAARRIPADVFLFQNRDQTGFHV